MRKPKSRRVKRPPTQLDLLMAELLQVNRKLRLVSRNTPRHLTGHLVSSHLYRLDGKIARLERQQKRLVAEIYLERGVRGLRVMSTHYLQSYGLEPRASTRRLTDGAVNLAFDRILSTPRRNIFEIVLTNPDRFLYRHPLMDPLVLRSLPLTPRFM